MYKEVVEEFAYWLQDFCFEYDSLNNSSRRLKNNKLYDLNKKEDYMQAIIEYISGMTDNKVINTYNKLISFRRQNDSISYRSIFWNRKRHSKRTC